MDTIPHPAVSAWHDAEDPKAVTINSKQDAPDEVVPRFDDIFDAGSESPVRFKISLNFLLPALVCLTVVVSGGVTAYLTTATMTDGIVNLSYSNAQQSLQLIISDVMTKIFKPIIRHSIEFEIACKSGQCEPSNYPNLARATIAGMESGVLSPVSFIGLTNISTGLISGETIMMGSAPSDSGTYTPCVFHSTPQVPIGYFYRQRDGSGFVDMTLPVIEPMTSTSATTLTTDPDNVFFQMLSEMVPYKTIIRPVPEDKLALAALQACNFSFKSLSLLFVAMRVVMHPIEYWRPIYWIILASSVRINVHDLLDDVSRRLDMNTWIVESSGTIYATTLTSTSAVDLLVNHTSGKLMTTESCPDELIRNSWAVYQKELKEGVVHYKDGNTWTAVIYAKGESFHVSAMSSSLEGSTLIILVFAAQPVSVVYSTLTHSVKQTILFDGLFMAGAFVLALLLSFLMTRPLAALSDRMRDVALLENTKVKKSVLSAFLKNWLKFPSLNRIFPRRHSITNSSTKPGNGLGTSLIIDSGGKTNRHQSNVWTNDEDEGTPIQGQLDGARSDQSAVGSRASTSSSTSWWAAAHISELSSIYHGFKNVENAIASFRMFVPEDVVRKLVRSGQKAEVKLEHAEITVMFCDLEDFTTLSEDLELADLAFVMQTYFDVVCRSVEASRGVIDKYIGDGVMAMWNASRKLGRHEESAMECSMLAVQGLRDASRVLQKRGLPAIRARFGFHTGKCLVGNVGSLLRLNYTSLGDVVNLASRLESLNKYYGTTILASQEMQIAVSDRFLCRWIDRVRVKGRKSYTDLYEIICLQKDASLAQLRSCELSATGMEALGCNNLQLALACFSEVSALMTTDKAVAILRERVEGFMQDPSTYTPVNKLEVK
mmetsp:Transcript_34581/g.55937  ORF Transcript_34581/g.55937 Transcript_34581/m.55937 type:complete len:884 (+) Transcript_34581:130-2781(+)|eukprot:CAMPEP_0184671830 /NCGR_PEP_ID=MMETSP0308-20130426/85702_1 /TAXON_ID=38269 /ORGANISM="Gloeochaete witrockiana, Strain SAG 46.84" /LENGTH=883 /DNA_ID=CAMNT_0027119031 /DNA_START=147 /DNA_END=2798 /DNA_ORIENTATION=-